MAGAGVGSGPLRTLVAVVRNQFGEEREVSVQAIKDSPIGHLCALIEDQAKADRLHGFSAQPGRWYWEDDGDTPAVTSPALIPGDFQEPTDFGLMVARQQEEPPSRRRRRS
jgi:hypothetical protein